MRSPDHPPFKVEPFPCTLPKSVHSAMIHLTFGNEVLQRLESLGFELPPYIERAVLKRRIEYLGGRFCALRALRKAGYVSRTKLLPDAHRAPQWPAGFVGSITHAGCLVSAAAAASKSLMSIGIDTELIVNSETADEVKALVLTKEEEAVLAAGLSPTEAVTLALSAKESIFKAFHPFMQRFIDFKEIVFTRLDGHRSKFSIRTVADFSPFCRRGASFSGAWSLSGDYVHTAIAIRKTGIARPSGRPPYSHA